MGARDESKGRSESYHLLVIATESVDFRTRRQMRVPEKENLVRSSTYSSNVKD